jgi:hypothetical protein
MQSEAGRRLEAFQCQAMALNLEPKSLLAKLDYAMFLSNADELLRAIAECDVIIDAATKQPFSETDEDVRAAASYPIFSCAPFSASTTPLV